MRNFRLPSAVMVKAPACGPPLTPHVAGASLVRRATSITPVGTFVDCGPRIAGPGGGGWEPGTVGVDGTVGTDGVEFWLSEFPDADTAPENDLVTVPPVPEAVIVKEYDCPLTDGVPVIAPVAAFNDTPVGSDPADTEYEEALDADKPSEYTEPAVNEASV